MTKKAHCCNRSDQTPHCTPSGGLAIQKKSAKKWNNPTDEEEEVERHTVLLLHSGLQVDWRDTNVANMGSDIEKELRKLPLDGLAGRPLTEPLAPPEVAALRGPLGRLMWPASASRPELAQAASAISGHFLVLGING